MSASLPGPSARLAAWVSVGILGIAGLVPSPTALAAVDLILHHGRIATGPDASLNSLALRRSGIDRDFQVSDGGSGFAEKDSKTGEPTGILRNATRYVKVGDSRRPPSRADKARRLQELFRDYNAVGITGVAERDASLYDRLKDGPPR